MYRRALVVIRC